MRADELERLKGALRDVEAARERLREQARHVFGGEADDDEGRAEG